MIETRESWVCRRYRPIDGKHDTRTVRHAHTDVMGNHFPMSAAEAAEEFMGIMDDSERGCNPTIVEVQHSDTEWRRYRVTCRVVRQYSAEEVQ